MSLERSLDVAHAAVTRGRALQAFTACTRVRPPVSRFVTCETGY